MSSLLSTLLHRLGKPPRTYFVSDQIGGHREMTDWEFNCFLQGHWHLLTKRRQHALSVVFASEPWLRELLRHRAMVQQSELAVSESFAVSSPSVLVLGPREGGLRVRLGWHLGVATVVIASVVITLFTINSLRSPLPADVVALAQLSNKHLDNADVWFGQTRNTSWGLDLLEPVDQVVTTLRPTLRWRATEPNIRVLMVSIFEGDRSSGEAVEASSRPSDGSWQPSIALQPHTLYTWRVDFELGDIRGNAVGKFATPSQTALSFTQGGADNLTIIQQCTVLIELQRYEEALALLDRALRETEMDREERDALTVLADRLRREVSGRS